MKSPYEQLGVTPESTDEQIKSAYREMAKKYHPDLFTSVPMQELAKEKMSELNVAYDEIMDMRRGDNSSSYSQIRNLVNQGNFADAEQMLNSVAKNSRGAEWFFLMGSVCYGKGWVDGANNNFATACNMDPTNNEYRAALERMSWQRGGGMAGNPAGGYRTSPRGAGGCSVCDICSAFICADCCCDCAGGGGCC